MKYFVIGVVIFVRLAYNKNVINTHENMYKSVIEFT